VDQVKTLKASKVDANASGETFYFTGKPCRRGHVANRLASSGTCVDCAAQWKRDNKSRVKEAKAASYRRHAAAHEKRNKRYRAKIRLESPWWQLIQGAKKRATASRIPFDLTFEWGKVRWSGACEVTGIPFNMDHGTGHSHPFSPSIDKIDCSMGYMQGNCRFVLHCVNMFKGVMSNSEMLAVARAISDSSQALAVGVSKFQNGEDVK
jgi:hypothetical protein